MPDEVIRELTKQALKEGNADALRDLIKELARKGRSGEIVKVVRDFLKSFPEQASAVKQVIKDLADILGKKVIRKTQAMAKVVEKLGKLIPKPRFGGQSGAWNLFRAVGKGIFNFVAGVVLRGVGFFGPVGFAVVVILAVILIAAALYFLLKTPSFEPYCDCTRVTSGLLTREYQEQCRDKESKLKELTKGCFTNRCIRNALKLKTGPDGKLVGGEFCDTIAHGPYGWPVRDGPAEPPPRPPDEKECKGVSGISRECD